MFVSETYDVVDGLLYRNGNVLIETPIPINFPSKYEVSYKVLKKATSLCVGTCNISDGTHLLGTGSFGSTASMGHGYYNGSSWNPLNNFTTINLNTEYLLTSVYDNGTFTTSINGQSDTISQSLNPTQISIGIANQTNIVFKDLLIKPL